MLKRVSMIAVAASFLVSVVASQADARGRGHGSSWVPKRAWKAVKRTAKLQLNSQAKLFKTTETRAHSLGLKGTISKAWIVGAKVPPTQGQLDPTFMPYSPRQAYFLVTKGENRRWQVTKLAGMGGRYLSKVDASSDNLRVGVGVAMGNPGKVGHGVEVSKAGRLSVTKGTQLAAKRNGSRTNTVYLKGQAMDHWGLSAKASLRAVLAGSSPSGSSIIKQIPVNFDQVMFAQPLTASR
jgi:hypothetical protein